MLDSSDTYNFEGYSFVYCTAAPTEWPQETHEQIEILVPLGQVNATCTWFKGQGQGHPQLLLPPQQICIIPAQQPHQLKLSAPTELMVIYLEPRFITHATHEIFLPPHWSLKGQYGIEDPIIHHTALNLRPWLTVEGAIASLYRTILAKLIAVHLLAKYAQIHIQPNHTVRQGVSKLAPVIHHVHTHLDEHLNITDLAHLSGMSPSHFSRLFKKSVGMSPHRYILSQRVRLAKQLLDETNLPLSNIALECGFYDHSHFIVQFRRFTGITPKGYRHRSKLNCLQENGSLPQN